MDAGMAQPRIRRRRFLDYLSRTALAGLAGAMAYPILSYLVPPKVKEVQAGVVIAAKASDLPPTSGKIFAFGSKPPHLRQLRLPLSHRRRRVAPVSH